MPITNPTGLLSFMATKLADGLKLISFIVFWRNSRSVIGKSA
ncbi:hypothetical protein ACFVAD_08590 [Sutcliffiella sp. NPDC057660]